MIGLPPIRSGSEYYGTDYMGSHFIVWDLETCCYAWNTLIDQPWKIMSIARRDWASMGYSM
jgi:hypothetical protein